MTSKTFAGALAVGVLALSGAVRAETVLWYRLDNVAAPGEVTTASTVITNIANPGVMDGKCYSAKFIKDGAATTYGTSPDLMPRGSVGFNGEYGIYDPVTANWTPRYNALHFGLETCTSGQKYGDGSTVKTDVGSNMQLSTLTVEVIFRAVETFPTSWNSCPIVMLDGVSMSNEGWFLGFGWDGKICTRFRRSNDTTDNVQGGVKTYGGWHHAAITADENGVVRVYYDYALENSKSGAVLQTFVNKAFTVASNPARDGRTFPGEVMDVRVSNVALDPSKFLRVTRPPTTRTLPTDTIVYLPYEQRPADTVSSVFDSFLVNPRNNQNVCLNGNVQADWKKSSSAVNPTFCPYIVPALAMRMGIDDTGALVKNASSLKGEIVSGTTTNTTAVTLGLANSFLEKTNFTAECFFKTSRQSSTYKESWTLFRSPCVKLGIGDNGKILARGFLSPGNYQGVVDQQSSSRVDDGKWHHAAFAYCVTNGTFTLYVDGEKQGVTKTITLGTNGTTLPSFGWQSGASPDQYFPGWIDEARITLRKLSPDEMLIADPAGRSGTLANITFENADYAVGPYPLFTPAGTGTARTGGSAPTFADAGFPGVYLDGAAKLTLRENLHALSLAGGQARFTPASTLRGQETFTVEWFMCLSSAPSGSAILRLNRSTTTFEGGDVDMVWQVYVYDSTKLRVKAQAAGAQMKDTPNFTALPGGVADKRWHHYAVTFERVYVSGTTKTEIRLYRDGVAYGMQQFTGLPSYATDDDCSLSIGANGNLTGLVDEVRITAGVLPVESFMRKQPRGMFLVVR